MKKLPPLEKIYEALTAVASNRVHISNADFSEAQGQATVTSSNGEKTYTVTWVDHTYTSDDNATYWQLYPGYPVIAVLMMQHLLPYPEKIALQLKDIDWNAENAKAKNNYAQAVNNVIHDRNLNASVISTEVESIYAHLQTLPITIKRATQLSKK